MGHPTPCPRGSAATRCHLKDMTFKVNLHIKLPKPCQAVAPNRLKVESNGAIQRTCAVELRSRSATTAPRPERLCGALKLGPKAWPKTTASWPAPGD